MYILTLHTTPLIYETLTVQHGKEQIFYANIFLPLWSFDSKILSQSKLYFQIQTTITIEHCCRKQPPPPKNLTYISWNNKQAECYLPLCGFTVH